MNKVDVLLNKKPNNLKEIVSSIEDLPNPEKSLHTYIHAATAENTRKAYRQDVLHFIAWGGMLPTTSEPLLQYLEQYAQTLNPRTLARRITAIKNWHLYQGFLDPTTHPLIRKTLKGIQKVHGKPKHKAPPLELNHLISMVHFLRERNKNIDVRNNALLQVGFFGAFRRSELATIEFKHLHFVNEGVEILIPRSKSDQLGKGNICAIPYGNQTLCAVSALKKWLEIHSDLDGPIFKRINKSGVIASLGIAPNHINLIIKELATHCQLPSPKSYSGHSLRRGFANAASAQGISLNAIMQQGRWINPATAMGYMEEANRFKFNAAGILLKQTNEKPR